MLRRLLLVLAGLVAAWLVVCAVLFVWPPAESAPPRHADAIVMLSGNHQRLTRALALAREGVAPVLVLSSVRSHTWNWMPARRLCLAGRYDGVRVLCVDAHPYDTRGEAETFSRLARRDGWRSLVVVTSTFHVTRASMLFERCFRGRLRVVGSPATWWRLPEEWASETAKLVYQLTVQTSC